MRRLVALFVAFGALGLLYGFWQVLLADLAANLELRPGPLGAAISAGFVASLPVMVAAGRISDAVGARRLGLVSTLLLAGSMAAFGLLGSYVALIAVLLIFMAASGSYDVAINAAGMAAERATDRRVLTLLHAGFSAGGAIGAVAAGALLAVGIGFRPLYGLVGILFAVLAGAAWWAHRIPAAMADVSVPSGRLYRDPILLLLAGIAALAFMSEGAMEGWSTIYLRGTLDLGPLLGASGVAVFHGAMTAGRLSAAGITARVGRMGALRRAGVAAVAGMILAMATEEPPIVLAGFLIVGLALAGMAPIAFSVAGDRRPSAAGRASAVITTIGYGGFLVGPALIGLVAELASLRWAFGVVVAAGALIALLATAVGRTFRLGR
jgi:MFS family permease